MLILFKNKFTQPLKIILVLFVLFFTSCENDLDKVNQVTAKNTDPVEQGTNVEILYSDSAKMRVKVNAAELKRFVTPKPLVEMPKGVHVQFYDDSLNVTSTLTSKYAIRKESEQIMEAKNDVVVVNSKGEKLNTEHLIWDEKTRKIYSKEFVKITTEDEIIFGNGFESNEDFSKYKIFNIKGTITINKDEHAKSP